MSKRTILYGAYAKMTYQGKGSVAKFTVGNATDGGTDDQEFDMGVQLIF